MATPSRLLAHLKSSIVAVVDSLKYLVVDEADLILSYNYESDMSNIVTFLPTIYQTFLMSATMSTVGAEETRRSLTGACFVGVGVVEENLNVAQFRHHTIGRE